MQNVFIFIFYVTIGKSENIFYILQLIISLKHLSFDLNLYL